jgi:hypothetical protein
LKKNPTGRTTASSTVAAAQDDQAIGTDFAVTRDDVPDKDPVYSPFVGQAHPDRVYRSPIWYTP